MDYYFDPQPAVDTTTAELVKVAGLSGTVYASEADASAEVAALTVTLAGGIESSSVPVSALGLTVGFTVTDYYRVWWRSGAHIVSLVSFDGMKLAFEAGLLTAQQISDLMVRSVNGLLPDDAGNVVIEATGGGDGTTTWGTLAGKPDTFPPSGHTHTRADLSDISTIARAFLSDATQQAMRTRIGAGTGNGTSDLQLGTTATTAAPGNHTHSQYVDADQAAAIADGRIAANGGGGGGGGQIQVWRYRSGAYPALPSSKPAGVELIHAMGPVAPSTLPSWVGNGPTQVPAEYVYNGGLT